MDEYFLNYKPHNDVNKETVVVNPNMKISKVIKTKGHQKRATKTNKKNYFNMFGQKTRKNKK